METCRKCGGAIVIRYMGGAPTPIHVDGGWCPGSRGAPAAATPRTFARTVSYVNPNAHCPVCRKQVYFYQSPHGGRVFFDDLGWPWPKHGCTDNPRSQQGRVELRAANVIKPFRDAAGEPLDLYELRSIEQKDGALHMQFGHIGENRTFTASLSLAHLRKLDITKEDLNAAPSFVVCTYTAERLIEFISPRKKQIDRFTAP